MLAEFPENSVIEGTDIDGPRLLFHPPCPLVHVRPFHIGQDGVKIDDSTTGHINREPQKRKHVAARYSFKDVTGSMEFDIKELSVKCGEV